MSQTTGPVVVPIQNDHGEDDYQYVFEPAALNAIKTALLVNRPLLVLGRPGSGKSQLAKAAASVDQLSQGRLIFGVASGDRPIEYSAYKVQLEERDEIFRETFGFIRTVTHAPQNWDNQLAVAARKVDLLPKSYAGDLPMLVTGNSRQTEDWIAKNADGWIMYPRPIAQQTQIVYQWQEAYKEVGYDWKPFSQSLYIDLADNPDAAPMPIHLGYRLGRNHLIAHLDALQAIGVNHVTFALRFSTRPIDEIIDELCEFVVPQFPNLSAA